MKSKNEEFCKSSFDTFIRVASTPVSIRWEDVAQQSEPPDYYLYVNDTKYAVEVTILMEKLEVGNLKLPEMAVLASLQQLVDEVEAVARKRNHLNGAYIVGFSRPIANFRKIREQLLSDLLAYVQATQNVGNAPEKVVFKQGVQKCTIQKLHDQKSYVGRSGPRGGKWDGEVAAEICALLEERVNDKHRKLRNISEPKILLLYDAYHFADPHVFQLCLNTLGHLRSFHTLFVVESNKPGWILHSEAPNWLN